MVNIKWCHGFDLGIAVHTSYVPEYQELQSPVELILCGISPNNYFSMGKFKK